MQRPQQPSPAYTGLPVQQGQPSSDSDNPKGKGLGLGSPGDCQTLSGVREGFLEEVLPNITGHKSTGTVALFQHHTPKHNRTWHVGGAPQDVLKERKVGRRPWDNEEQELAK